MFYRIDFLYLTKFSTKFIIKKFDHSIFVFVVSFYETFIFFYLVSFWSNFV